MAILQLLITDSEVDSEADSITKTECLPSYLTLNLASCVVQVGVVGAYGTERMA